MHINSERKGFFLKLKEIDVERLPVGSPIGRRIIVLTQREDCSLDTKELFVQRNDAFSTDLFGLLKELKNGNVSELRYAIGLDGLIRIFLDEQKGLVGEFYSESENTLNEFKKRMNLS